MLMRSRMSAKSLATANIAMISDDTVIWNPLVNMNPSILPPIPMTISRNACAQKSIDHIMAMFLGSMFNRLRFFLARTSSP